MARESLTTAELLMDLLELTSLGAASPRHLVAELRKRHAAAPALKGRVESGLGVLEGEGLVEAAAQLGRRVYRATEAGLTTLEEYGRYPNGAAVLFTDLVGSTALIGAFGETEAHALRLRHFALLRAPVVRHGGREVKGLGDGLMIVFSDPASALDCAVDMQRAVGSDDDGLGLRVGIHAGPLLREHDDFHGTTVIIAARLCDRAQSGQILASVEALEAADDARTAPIEFLGDLALKGLDDAVPTYEVVSSDRARAADPSAPNAE